MLCLFISPLASNAVEEEEIRLIFDQYNQAMINLDFDELEKYKMNVQASELYKCMEDPQCGPGMIEKMRVVTLSDYTITNFVEYAKGMRIVQISNPNADITPVNGPATELYYEGTNVNGRKGKGEVVFIIEDAVWKVSGMSWKPEPRHEDEQHGSPY